MKNSVRTALVFAVLAGVVPTVAHAHFKLLEPASWIIENERGDPQKAGPCGGTNTDYGKPSFIINKAVGGSKLHIKVQETIYHPGHYRVALAVNSPLELPVDPKAETPRAKKVRARYRPAIMSPVQMPVLADGLSPHTAKVDTPFETDIELPNINCKKCTLQVIQFMADHAVNNPGMYLVSSLRGNSDYRRPEEADRQGLAGRPQLGPLSVGVRERLIDAAAAWTLAAAQPPRYFDAASQSESG